MTPLVRKTMLAVARKALVDAERHRLPERAEEITTTTQGEAGRRLRALFADVNREWNSNRERSWRQRIETYEAAE